MTPIVEMTAPPRMFAFTAEHHALREVLGDYFESTARLDPWTRWRRLLREVGADDILIGSSEGENCSAAVELAILAEEAGAALFGGPLLSTATLGPLATEPTWASLIDRVRRGERGVSAMVTLTGGDERQGRTAVTPVWDFVADTFVLVEGSCDGEPTIAAFDGAAVGFAELSGMDLSRSLGMTTSMDAEPLLVHVNAAGALTSIRLRSDLVISAELLGVAQRVLDKTVEYVSHRVQFGRTIGSFQAIKHRLSDMLAQVELTRSAVYGAAWHLDHDPAATQTHVDLAVAAVLSRQTAVDLTKAAVQLHGGIAITWEHWAHRYLRRAHSMMALTGSPSRHRHRLTEMFVPLEAVHD